MCKRNYFRKKSLVRDYKTLDFVSVMNMEKPKINPTEIEPTLSTTYNFGIHCLAIELFAEPVIKIPANNILADFSSNRH